ncbi:MAG: helix-turn-helix domain-containing protein [Gammaproteobacteria bacterium]
MTQYVFTDFEVFSETVRGYDLECRQLAQGRFSATALQVATGNVLLSRLTANLVLEAEGNPPPGMITVGIPTAKCRPFVWRHQHTNAKTLQFYSPGTELLVNTSGAFDAIDLSFTETHLLEVAETLKLYDAYKRLKHGRMVAVTNDDLEDLRQMSQWLVGLALTRHSAGNKSRMAHIMEFTLPGTLLRIMDKPATTARGGRHSNSLDAFKRARSYIHSHDDANITVSDLCNLTHMSDRTLQKVFVAQCGVTPKAYIRAVRLSRAHAALLENCAETTSVTDVANYFGFWHIGQFAADYRALFSELPSETLARAIS